MEVSLRRHSRLTSECCGCTQQPIFYPCTWRGATAAWREAADLKRRDLCNDELASRFSCFCYLTFVSQFAIEKFVLFL
jgi:hypothetical protein